MKNLIISKSGVAYAASPSNLATAEAAVTPDLLAPGAIGAYGFHTYSDNVERFALITTAASTSTLPSAGSYKAKATDYNGNKVQFYMGATAAIYNNPNSLPTTQPKQTNPIQLRGIKKITGTPFLQAQLQVTTITPPALPATTTINDVYTLKVTKVPNTRSVFSWSFQATGVMANAAALCTALVADYTAKTTLGGSNGISIPFTLTVSGSTILLSALNYGDAFTVASQDLLYPVSTSFSTPLELGNGNYYQVYTQEKDTLGEQGFLDQIDRRGVPVALLADANSLYDTYVFEFTNTLDNRDEMDDTFNNNGYIIFYIPQGSSQASVLESMFNTFSSRGLLGAVPVFNNTAQTVNGTTTTTTTTA